MKVDTYMALVGKGLIGMCFTEISRYTFKTITFLYNDNNVPIISKKYKIQSKFFDEATIKTRKTSIQPHFCDLIFLKSTSTYVKMGSKYFIMLRYPKPRPKL